MGQDHRSDATGNVARAGHHEDHGRRSDGKDAHGGRYARASGALRSPGTPSRLDEGQEQGSDASGKPWRPRGPPGNLDRVLDSGGDSGVFPEWTPECVEGQERGSGSTRARNRDQTPPGSLGGLMGLRRSPGTPGRRHEGRADLSRLCHARSVTFARQIASWTPMGTPERTPEFFRSGLRSASRGRNAVQARRGPGTGIRRLREALGASWASGGRQERQADATRATTRG